MTWSTRLYTINCLGMQPRTMPRRSKVLAAEINAARPDIILAQECYVGVRQIIQKRLASRYVLAGAYRGKVIWLDDSVWGSSRKKGISLGNGKHAVSVLGTRRDDPSVHVAISSGHLISGDGLGTQRITQMRRWAQFVKTNYPPLPLILGGDLNDFRDERSGVRREAANRGLHDAFADLDEVMHGEFNSYNGLKRPAPKDGRHIDAFLLSPDLVATSGKVDTHDWPYGSDHFGVDVRIRSTS